MGLAVLLPQQLQGHPLAFKLLVDDTPVGHLKAGLSALSLRVEPLFQIHISQPYRQRPAKSKLLGPFDEALCSAGTELNGGGYLTNR